MRLFLVIFAVEALAASWIEIQRKEKTFYFVVSKPLRLRGLKFTVRQLVVVSVLSKPLRLRGLKSEKITGKKLGDSRSPCGFVD